MNWFELFNICFDFVSLCKRKISLHKNVLFASLWSETSMPYEPLRIRPTKQILVGSNSSQICQKHEQTAERGECHLLLWRNNHDKFDFDQLF